MATNPLTGWKLDRARIKTIGKDLKRPECILAEPNGDLWAADARGGVMRICPDGTQQLITQRVDSHFDRAGDLHTQYMQGTLPNGLAFSANGEFLISNFGTDQLELMARDGRTKVLLSELNGQPIGKVNFVLRDSKDRIWVTVSTKVNPWVDAIRPGLADGFIVLIDGGKARVVADAFCFTNEIRFDAHEEWLYVVETTGKRISRLRVGADGSLSGREVFGPASLGTGFPDGMAFDAWGNLWITMVMADRLVALTPEGELLELFDDGDPAATAELEARFAAGTVTTEVIAAAHGTLAPWFASVTFGGPDLRTAYLGSLRGTAIPYFDSPVAGLPMVHWHNASSRGS